jgi:hypothetical protein
MRLDADGRTVLASDAPVVLRNLELGGGHMGFDTHSVAPVTLRLEHPTSVRQLEVDGVEQPGEGSSVQLSPGVHTVRVLGSPA